MKKEDIKQTWKCLAKTTQVEFKKESDHLVKGFIARDQLEQNLYQKLAPKKIKN